MKKMKVAEAFIKANTKGCYILLYLLPCFHVLHDVLIFSCILVFVVFLFLRRK